MIVNSGVCPLSVHHPSTIRLPSIHHPSTIRLFPSFRYPAPLSQFASVSVGDVGDVGDVIAFLRGRARIALGLDQLRSIAALLTTV